MRKVMCECVNLLKCLCLNINVGDLRALNIVRRNKVEIPHLKQR